MGSKSKALLAKSRRHNRRMKRKSHALAKKQAHQRAKEKS